MKFLLISFNVENLALPYSLSFFKLCFAIIGSIYINIITNTTKNNNKIIKSISIIKHLYSLKYKFDAYILKFLLLLYCSCIFYIFYPKISSKNLIFSYLLHHSPNEKNIKTFFDILRHQ